MTKLAVHIRYTARQGRGDELAAAIEDMFDTVVNEPDTLVYAHHRDVDEPDVIWMYQLYADRKALETHRSSPAMDRLKDRLDELLAHEPEIGLTRPVRAKGLRIGG